MDPSESHCTFSFECSYDYDDYYNWISEHDYLPPVCCAVYVAVIFGIKRAMRKRKPFSLRRPLIAWNAFLAVFSILATVRFLPPFLSRLNNGLYFAICDYSYTTQKISGFWGTWFMLMKLVELGDTLFIVLRKRPLMFLHWYHHITVCLYTFYSYLQVTSAGSWFIAMNITVHAVMYTYFTLAAMRVKIPKVISKTITSLQLLQMVSGLGVNATVLYYHAHGLACDTQLINVFYSVLMYFSYAVLFGRFFRQAYIEKRKRKQSKSK